MNIKHLIYTLLGARLQIVLIVSFVLVAALTVALNTVVIAGVINDYLADAEAGVVINLAQAFYQLKQDEIAAFGYRLVLDPQLVQHLPAAQEGHDQATQAIDARIVSTIGGLSMDGTHLILVLDGAGEIVAGRVIGPAGDLSPRLSGGSWGDLPIVAQALASGQAQVATEVIPTGALAVVGLAEQAAIPLIDTPLASPEPFDPREGSAGLALTAVHPVQADGGAVVGAVVVAHLFNNDFTLVDQIRDVGGIDTVTIFFGDLRVSTNVMTEAGARAVGTRVSEAVREVVLEQGQHYVGRAYVVNEWLVTRYEPLRDHAGQVVGSLYVGSRASAFLGLMDAFNRRVLWIALIPGCLAGLIAVPIAGVITRPLAELVAAHQRLAQGDMAVRVQTYGRGEVAVLGQSFNSMAETLYATQQELLHKEKLASMGQLAAGVAHEINNPLGTILLFAETLYNEASEGAPQRSDLKMIIDETHRCKRIVADLLNFARQQEVLAQETDLCALLETVAASMCQQPRFEHVQIVRQFDPAVPTVQADTAQLQQVFVNLLDNAVEAMAGQGSLTLRVRPLDSDWVEVQVSDTGCGIPEEHLGRLFTPFFTTKPTGKGTGLGLAIVYGIVKMHRGQITVRSTVGQGTTFSVMLPVRLPQGFGTKPLGLGDE
ncbi:MAG: cache domain-containing protein [Anaerolineae bacterium]|nr:cache domain-containing protein [Anaerolineae bacterium]